MTTPLTILHGGRRKVMRIGANDSMSTVVQMACKDFGLDAGALSFVLTHKRATVDLSQPFRFTGIPQNATLELAEGAAVPRRAKGAAGSGKGGGQVRVAMRLPGGSRVQASFSSETTLLELLQWWAERGEIDAGVLQQGPTLQFMRTAYGAGELESTSLQSIGLLTGSAIFNLSLASPSAASRSAYPSPPVGPPPANVGVGSGGISASTAAADPSPTAQEEAEIARAIALSVADNPDVSSSLYPPSSQDTAQTRLAPDAATASMDGVGKAASELQESGDVVGRGSGDGVAAAIGGVAGVAVQPGAGQPYSPVPDTSSGSALQGGGAMEVERDNAVEPREEAPLPAMGVEVCRAALDEMTAGHFDADSAACVITLAKMIDNVVHRPDNARTRQIRCANAAFQQKVGRIRGGIGFLEGVGFVSKKEEEPLWLLGGASDGGSAGEASRVLVLPRDREDSSLLKMARTLLTRQAESLGVGRERMPQPPRAPPPLAAAISAQGVAFDPYKPFVTSTAPTPKGPQEQSATETRLQELLAKRADVVAGGVPDRNVQVTLPSQAAAMAALAASGKGGADDANSGGFGRGGTEGGGGDGGLIAKKVARQMAERKKREDVPFQTKAMREIERLQKATVYRTTVIKVQFPDRVILQATFASTEGVKDLVHVVRSCLGDSHRSRELELYVSPPRMVLKETSSLSDAGLVPAALVYVSWKQVPPAGEPEGAYLKPELTSDSAGGGEKAARPVGVVLDEGAEESKRGAAGGHTRGGTGTAGSARESGSKGKRTGKPSWLKIN